MTPDADTASTGSFCQAAWRQALPGGHCRGFMTMLPCHVLPRFAEDRNRMQCCMCGRHTEGPPYWVVIWYSHGDEGAAAMFGSQSFFGLHRCSGIHPAACRQAVACRWLVAVAATGGAVHPITARTDTPANIAPSTPRRPPEH